MENRQTTMINTLYFEPFLYLRRLFTTTIWKYSFPSQVRMREKQRHMTLLLC